MSEETQKQKITKVFNSPESHNNIVEFFDLLLKVDMRINPQDYKNNKEEYAGYSDNDN